MRALESSISYIVCILARRICILDFFLHARILLAYESMNTAIVHACMYYYYLLCVNDVRARISAILARYIVNIIVATWECKNASRTGT